LKLGGHTSPLLWLNFLVVQIVTAERARHTHGPVKFIQFPVTGRRR
jgi:hypothetical protein